MKTPINFKNKNMIEKEAPGRNLKPSWRRRFPRGGERRGMLDQSELDDFILFQIPSKKQLTSKRSLALTHIS
jgi:hypothetical protein